MNDERLIGLIHDRFVDCGWFDEEDWSSVESQFPDVNIDALLWMEKSGGEPAVAPWWKPSRPLIICDYSKESPSGRRGLCYDHAAWEKRKKARPDGDAMSLAESHGVRLMDESEYLKLQECGEFDTKSSSWLLTDDSIRDLGGAIFGDRRFNRAFIYCNGAESYYGVRGFRTVLEMKP